MGIEAVLERALEAIGKYGVCITCVSGGNGTVPWAYTAGLTAAGHPELVLMGGIKPEYAVQALNNLAGRVLKGGVRFRPGDRLDDVITGHDVVIAGPVAAEWAEMYPLNMAQTIYAGQVEPALQVVYPDNSGAYPWQEGYEQGTTQILLTPTPPGV